MASASFLLSEEQLLCSICLHVFSEPVTTACGHNFCLACITQHWDAGGRCQCPLCKTAFSSRPELKVNALLSEICAPCRRSADLTEECAETEGELCDLCTGAKVKAVKSCLVCEASYCATHLEPHQTVPRLKRHLLNDPMMCVDNRVCKKHGRPLEMFCKTDQVCVCQICSELDHMSHVVVPLDEEYKRMKDQLEKTEAKLLKSIKERQEKVKEIKTSVDDGKSCADKQIENCVKVFTAVMKSIENTQVEFITSIQNKLKSVEREAEGFIRGLKQEIRELTKISSKLEKLSHTEDQLYFLQNFPSPPQVNNWKNVYVYLNVSSGQRDALAMLEETLKKKMKKLEQAQLCDPLWMVNKYMLEM